MIVADSSSIISMAMNCMTSVLGELGVKIVVTPAVYNEIITKPIDTKRFALEAMRIGKLFSDGIIETKKANGPIADEILDKSNAIFSIRGKPLKVIHRGEAEALALVNEIKADAFLIDERTMRLLLENPYSLKEVLSHRNKKDVKLNQHELEKFKKMLLDASIIRSTEIAAIAYERGILQKYLSGDGDRILEAVLCALKFSGCSISWNEIDEYKRIIQ